MTLSIYNTKSKSKERFEPLDPTHVRFYVCGPTVYGPIHVGNARPIVVFDVLFRLLRALYPEVTYVRNITDVDDKIIEAAKQVGGDIGAACHDLTQRMTALFHENVADLGALTPTQEPRATAHIPQMLDIIARLLESGHAYEAEGHVLFSVTSFASYGALSGRALDDLLAGARVEVESYKRHPGDFVLWKPAMASDVGWDSPWGYGRPGWHIECSAMSKAYLGPTFDIHGGGLDLIFPHHENERAQSMCGAETDCMAKYWMHNGYVVVGGEKMSKSLGNFLTVQDVLARFSGDVVRYVLLNAHYRQPLDIGEDGWSVASKALYKFRRALKGYEGAALAFQDLRQDFRQALLDDLNTPLALSLMHDQASLIGDPGMLLGMAQVLGFTLKEKKASLTDEAIIGAIEARTHARLDKDFALADRIRNDLLAEGILLEDFPEGTTWRQR